MASSSSIDGNDENRIIALVDMDCFYVQVEQRKNPELRGKPCVVVQYKRWKGGGIIAVGYEARKFGITRQMRGDEAKERCSDLNVIYVPENRGKADLASYRQAGAEVIKVLAGFSDCLERASVDEAFIDLSEVIKRYKSKYTVSGVAIKLLSSSHVIGLPNPRDPPQEIGEEAIRESEAYGILIKKLMAEPNLNLAIGGIIANEMRDAVLEKTQFTCSAGIAQNKMLAKLIAGLHKPNQQTVLFQEDLNALFDNVKMRKVRHLGGKLGETLHQAFKVEMMSDLARISTAELRQQFGEKTGDWLYLLGKGIDHEPVRPRQLPKSVGCCKNFRGKEKLAKVTEVSYWLNQLASEVCERLQQEVELNNRIPTHLCVNLSNSAGTSVSRSCGVSKFDAAQVTADALGIIKTFNKSQEPDTWDPPIVHLGLSASKFTEKTKSLTKSIRSFFKETATQLSQYDQSNGNVDRPDNAEPDYSTPVSELNSNHSHEMPSGKNRSGSTSKEKVTNRLTRFFNSVPRPVSSMSSHESPVHGEASQCSSRSRKKFGGIKQMSSSLGEANNFGTRQATQVDSFQNYFDRSNIADMSCEELVSDSLTADDFTICKKCGRRVVAWELPEHNDFHFAEELQTSMNNNNMKNEAALGLSPPKKKIRPANYNISSFFKSK